LGITAGPDGNLWFTERSASQIGQINPTSHAFAEFPVTTAGSFPLGITAGPDGNLWFTERSASQIGQINPTSHAIAEFPTPTASSGSVGITSGPDGNLWFTEAAINANKIGQVVLAAPVTAPDLALSGTAPTSVTLGSNLTESLTVTNDGTAGATGVSLTDTLPAGVKFVSATGGITPFNGVLTFALGSLAPGASTSVTIVVNPTAAGTLTDSAAVGMDQGDPTPADNGLTRSTTVTSPGGGGPTSVTPTARGDGPRITAVHRFGFHLRPTTLVLTFDESLDPTRAQDLANYHIVALAAPGGPIRIKSAIYDATTRTVTLKPVQRLNLHHRFRLTIKGTGPGGISDTSANLLDGEKTGNPGSDFATIIVAADLALTPAELKDPGLLKEIEAQSASRRRTASD
jgi:uncharacterized repeat protein (TIGR01451 family)